MKISKKNALILAPSMLVAADLAMIEGGSAGPVEECDDQGNITVSEAGEGFHSVQRQLSDRRVQSYLAETPPDGPARVQTEGY